MDIQNFQVINLPLVSVAPNAVSLINQFIVCPAAVATLTAVATPVFIQLDENFENDGRTSFGEKGSIIRISNKLPQKRQLHVLSFELFNSLSRKEALEKKISAQAGKLGMDDFAISVEKIEIENLKKSYALYEECFESWNLSDTPHEKLQRQFDMGLSYKEGLWMQEVSCHTDYQRRYWIAHFKDNYCRIHGEDTRSCTAKAEDLCPYVARQNMPDEKFFERVRDWLSKATPKLKAYYAPQIASIVPNNPKIKSAEKFSEKRKNIRSKIKSEL